MPPPPASAGAGAFKEDEMRTIAMLLLAIAACSAEILRYDTDTPILPYGVSHDWRGVYFDLDDWDTMSYPHATGTFRVDSIEVWYNRWTSPPECKYVIALFSDDCGGLGSPPPCNMVWKTVQDSLRQPSIITCDAPFDVRTFTGHFWIAVAKTTPYGPDISLQLGSCEYAFRDHSYHWQESGLRGLEALDHYQCHSYRIRAHGEWVQTSSLPPMTWGSIKATLGR